MTTKILEFKKANHFMLSQWDRSIDDQLLYHILPFTDSSISDKKVILVMPSFLKRKNAWKDEVKCLILIAKRKLLITAYWCDSPNYLFKKEKNAQFQIIY